MPYPVRVRRLPLPSAGALDERNADQVFARIVLELGGTGAGGTADVVLAAARERELWVTVVWPDGAVRG